MTNLIIFFSQAGCLIPKDTDVTPLQAGRIRPLRHFPCLRPFQRGSGANAASRHGHGHNFRGPTEVSCFWIILFALLSLFPAALNAADSPPARMPILRSVDLDVNEAQELELANGTRTRVKLLRLDETRDAMRDAVRQALVQIELNGKS